VGGWTSFASEAPQPIRQTALTVDKGQHVETERELDMNRDTLKGQWTQLKGKVRQEWGKLTDDDLDKIQGNYEMLVGRLQELYGRSREETEKDLERRFQQWEKTRP
jgi:uncharacterized protein YjbJ (UPF0337 family)